MLLLVNCTVDLAFALENAGSKRIPCSLLLGGAWLQALRGGKGCGLNHLGSFVHLLSAHTEAVTNGTKMGCRRRVPVSRYWGECV